VDQAGYGHPSLEYMRLDHIAYRVADRRKTADFFVKAMNYRVAEEFEIFFDEAKTVSAKCLALIPLQKLGFDDLPFRISAEGIEGMPEYHLAPEIFVSDGNEGSIVGDWVKARGGIGGIHHIAYQVECVNEVMLTWKEKGYGTFTTDKPLTCPGLVQAFTHPHPLTGVIYEFIERTTIGFCKDNVRSLMESTKGLT
jgi:catechol 2,3-dioxygenase-like lactoylglutathione lyase family enzyme